MLYNFEVRTFVVHGEASIRMRCVQQCLLLLCQRAVPNIR
jgi:hypothetical protein